MASSHEDSEKKRLSLPPYTSLLVVFFLVPVSIFAFVMFLRPETIIPIMFPITIGGVIVASLVFMFTTLGPMINGEPDWVAKDEPLIPLDKLPRHVKTYGILVKDIWQCPGNVEFADGSLTFMPQIGENTTVKLSDVRSVRFTNGFNGSIREGQYGINLRVKGHARLGFSITDVEPWRSILLHHIKLDTKSKR